MRNYLQYLRDLHDNQFEIDFDVLRAVDLCNQCIVSKKIKSIILLF